MAVSISEYNCKVCNQVLSPSYTLSLNWRSYECAGNKHYELWTFESNTSFEVIRTANYRLQFYPTHHMAELYNPYGFYKKIDMQELTSEIAVQWFNRLQLYSVFR